MIFFIFLHLANGYLHQYLHRVPALDNQCSNENNIGENYLVGENYFYNYFTQGGAYVDFSKLTFILWVQFVDNNPYKSTGKQILFQLVDGSDDNPYVNLQLSVFPSNGQLQLALYSGEILISYKPQYQMTLSGVTNADKLLGWNQIVISIDQSMSTSYLNMKLYNSVKNTNYQLQVPIINGTIFTYRISQQTRLTNEALTEQYKVENRACAFIANFHYYIGWTTLDTEVVQDYSSQQVFYVQPNGYTLDSLINQITIKSQSGIFYDQQSLQIFKSTRLEYIFKQEMDSFIMSFWMNPNIITQGNINPNYQLFSLTDDSLLKTAIGIGINNKLQLIKYQRFDIKSITQLVAGWTHVIAYITQNSWTDDFIPESIKLMTIYINGVNVTQFQVDNIFQWSRVVIGFLFRDVKDGNYVLMKEIQMYSGMSLSRSKFGCLILSDNYCILCDPKNSQFTYTASQCPQQTFQQSCETGTTSCNITVSQGIITYKAILCQNQYTYDNNQKTCVKGSAYPCGLSMSNGCADCQTGTLKTLAKGERTCISECFGNNDGPYNFNDNGVCKQLCPYYATYSFDCSLNVTVVKCWSYCPYGYVQVNNGICQHPDFAPIQQLIGNRQLPIKGLIYNYDNYTPSSNQKNYATYKNAQILFPYKYFNSQKTQLQYFKGCQKMPGFGIQQNVTQLCQYPCGLCFSTTASSCLTCQDPKQFLDRQFSSCVKSCDLSKGILKLNHKQTMTCEQTCPQGYYKQEIECVASCSQNYYLFKGLCTKTIPQGYYIQQNTISPCPQVCKTCTSQSTCQICVGNYPKDGSMCVAQCPYFLDFATNTCVLECKSSDLVFKTTKLNGFAFKVCFKDKCGSIQANKLIQTVQHQTNQTQCAQPCDDGYYADLTVLKCLECKSPCKTCQNYDHFCLTCIPSKYLYLNNCFDNCPDMFEDNINQKCVGGCDVGFSLVTDDIKACVQYCDNNKYGEITYYYKYQCLITPLISTYCTGQHCFDCDSTCYTCNGPSSYQCLSCTNLYFYDNKCHTTCPYNLYSISTDWSCQSSCPVGTFTMDSYRGCVNPCPAGTHQYKNRCYQYQPQSTYCNQVQRAFICYDCYQTCQSCTDKPSNKCTSCKEGYYFWQQQCLTKCPKKTFSYQYKCYTQCPFYLKMQDETCVFTCDPNYISFSNYCGTTCPDGYYKQELFCYLCSEGCATCTSGDSDRCQSCLSGYFFQEGKSCKRSCPKELPFRNQISNICSSKCPNIGFINALADATYCVLRCPSYYYGRLCQPQCPYQTWANGNECRVCDKNCGVCFGDLISQCSSCSPGFYLDQSTCVEQCPSQRPFANQVDKKCVQSCPIYTFLQSMYCFSSCPSYLYNYELNNKLECVRLCYPNSYISGKYCLACAPQCIYCYDSNANSCLQCQTGYYLSVTTCQSTCPNYYDEVNKTCVPNCDPSQHIFNNKCLSDCPQGYLNQAMQCVVSCPKGTYKSNLLCLPCHSSCLDCLDGTNQKCSSCLSNYFMDGQTCTLTCPILYDYINYKCVAECPNGLYQLGKQCVSGCPDNYLIVSDKFSCLQQCPTGYFQEGQECLKCDPICTKCTALDECQACAQDYALNINKCVQICWLDDKLFYDKANRLCQSICSNYHYQAYDKYICVDKCETYHFGKFCVDQCPSGYYGDTKNICVLCPTNCSECTAKDKCTSCVTNFILTKGQCSNKCISQYLDVTTHQCVDSCPLNKYLLVDQCLTSCPSPTYFTYKFVCYTQCPKATYRSGQDCLDCSPECTSCYGPTSEHCESCSEGYYLNNQICTKTCPTKYYYDQKQFVCTLKCDKKLFENDDTCLEACPELSYYEKCVSSCPLHTYQYKLKCQDCRSICLTCNQFECLSCVGGYFLNNGVCDLLCPNIYDQVNNKCVDQCDAELYQFMNSCLKTCPDLPTFSYQQECLLECPQSTAIVGNTCQSCQERCQKCFSAQVCVECQQGYNLYNGKCLVACPLANPYLEDGSCVIKCSDSTFYNKNNCVIECPNKYYLQQCVDKCPDGYFGEKCSPCKSQCKTCSSYQTCTSCNANYFLEQTVCDTQCPYIYDTIKWECTDTCNGLLNGLLCLSQCPEGLVQQAKLCQNTCDDGYYNDNAICTLCPRECQLCTSASTCQQCSISYYLYNSSCLAKCPIGQFSDPKSKKCVANCPNNMVKYQTQCLFSCPRGYVANNQQCSQECSHNQLQIGQICFNCPLECNGCKGFTNSDCTQCSKDAVQKDKLCISKSCISGYALVDGFCMQCQFNCQTCDQNSCLTCRGDRITKLCTCSKGYFDDGVDDLCQKCPCDECTSINSCTKCKNNLKTPNCSCDRQLNSDWCIDCDIGRTNIKFSFDLNSIIVEFGYLISINLLNPFQPSSCNLWFVNYQILGVNSLCHLVWNRTQVIIQLGQQATVTIGDSLEFQQNFYKDVNDQQCSGFIYNFIDSSVKSPDLLIKPYVEFDNPQLISNCLKIKIKQVSIWGTGQRELQILQWKLMNDQDLEEDHYFQLSDYLQQQRNYLEFDINVLKPNQTYIIQAKYTNILKRLNTTIIKFKTNLQQKPYVYLTFNPLTAHAYIFDCQTFQDLQLTYSLSILIQKQDEILVSENLIVVNTYQIVVDESKLPRGELLLVTAQIDETIIRQNVTLQLLPHLLKFKYQSRFLGLQGSINARGFDQNILDQTISQFNFKYQWVCTNLHNLEPCKSQQNQIIKFVDSRILQIQLDSPNNTFAFYCNASKDGRWTVEVQKIVITNLNIQNDFVENTGKSLGHINPNDDIFIILKQPQQYAMIMYEYLLIGTIKISGQGLKFKLADYLNESHGDIAIYLLPSNESLKYSINYVQVQGQLEVSPKEGYSLDLFTITMNITLDQMDLPLKYGFFEYFQYSELAEDVAHYQIVNGIPLGQFQTNNTINAYLINGLENVYILCQVIDIKGFVFFFNETIRVKRKHQSYQQNLIALPKKDQSLQQINAALQMLKEESKQVCLKQCSGVGTCIQGKCQCPPGYYFDDCSGSKADAEIQKHYISDTLDQLFNSTVVDDQQYKLFIQSLSYLTIYQESFDKYNSAKALVQLGIVSDSLSNRINKINQLGINLQFKSIDSFQHDSLDISQIVQISDLKQTMQCHDLIWYILLQNKTGNEKYQIQYQTRQIIQQIIQLSFFILQPDDFVDFSGAGGTLLINRSNQSTIQSTQGRILATVNQQYDLVQAKYLNNLYQEDGYFPYPKQKQPLYDYSIRLAGRQQNIKLQYTMNYTFQVESENRYICIMRNQTTFGWEYQNCNTTYINKTIQCNCTLLAPTTIVDDKEYLVTGNGEKRIQLPNFIILVLLIQTFLWICLLMAGIKQDRQILNTQIVHNQSQSIKYGMVKSLNKQVRKSLNLDGINIVEPTTPELFNENYNEQLNNVVQNTDNGDEFLVNKDELNQNKIAQKYSLENFQKQHSILNIIYKYKKFQPRWFRSTLILMRWTFSLTMAGLFAYLQLLYEISVYPTIGAFLFSRVIETFINQQFKQTSYIDSLVLKLVYLTFIFLITMSSLIGFWVIYSQIENQTDWIISYLISFAIDILCLDLISMIANKYLGEDLKIRLRKQIKKVKKQHEMQKLATSREIYY